MPLVQGSWGFTWAVPPHRDRRGSVEGQGSEHFSASEEKSTEPWYVEHCYTETPEARESLS